MLCSSSGPVPDVREELVEGGVHHGPPRLHANVHRHAVRRAKPGKHLRATTHTQQQPGEVSHRGRAARSLIRACRSEDAQALARDRRRASKAPRTTALTPWPGKVLSPTQYSASIDVLRPS